ncbi:hypothetical protein [Chryseobacterium sp. MFBS3-17]|uniref:hypothetical protein n=1 Tax=Chryseobacterium sp. MFBS3-17 TaxID=2886689 RepID=UPI001D0DDC12|nr:hypothetical protein [Chryseobacterium sp. MFBS3-17]MCC2590337.1 hypothetical protein [Chryseobacterium sp. MFBS3-17]
MTDQQFIFIIKAKLKLYYQEGRSVGMDLRELVARFRQEIEDDCFLTFNENQKNESKNKNRSGSAVSRSPDRHVPDV